MDPMTIGALIGLGKSLTIDKAKEKKDRELAAKTIELSPWTGLQPNKIREADPFGTTAKYAATGASMDRQMKYDEAMMKALDRGEYGSILKSDGGWSGINAGGGTPVYGLQVVQPFSQDQIYAYGG